jgi:murein DD-endopeptidase MepM/ murein hydrolase activator NlpD
MGWRVQGRRVQGWRVQGWLRIISRLADGLLWARLARPQRGSVRAGIRRRALLIGILPLLGFALLLPSLWRQPQTSPPAKIETEVSEAPLAESPTYTVTDSVRRGDTFSGLLLRNRLSMQDIGRVLDLTRRLQLFSPRSLQPGQELTLTLDDYGRLSRLVFQLSPEETYVYETRRDSLIAFLQPVDRDVRLRKFEGEVETTFDDAVRKAGGDYRLTLKVADVFAYDVDFLTEVHRGDRFSMLVEERFADNKFVGYGEVLYGRYAGAAAKSSACYFRADPARRGGYYDTQGKALKRTFLSSPLNYRRISSLFTSHRFHPILKTYRPHHGVDYAAASGTPVVAVAEGTVSFRGWKGGYGNMLRIRHGGGMETVYGHLSKFANGIRVGSRVSQGQLVGAVGRTGMATGPHLHYEVVQKGAWVNPLSLKNLPGEPINAAQMARFTAYVQNLEQLDKALLVGQVVESFDAVRLDAALAQLQDGDHSAPAR